MTTRPVARWIEACSWGFAALGLFLPVLFHTALFLPYRETLSRWAFGVSAIPAAHADLAGLMLGITGGSIAGKWIVHALVARGPLAEGRAWARDITIRGLAAWFIVDSAASLAVGASFNVWMINLLPVVLVGLPLASAYSRFGGDERGNALLEDASGDSAPRPLEGSARACAWAALFGAATGIAIAFGGTTPLFAQWFAGLESAHYGGAALDPAARKLALAFFGPIGGCTVAQFVMLHALVRREPERVRTAIAGSVSIVSWFVIDSSYGAAHRGLFNIVMVNLPAMAVTLPPWLLLGVRTGRAPAREP